MVKKAFLKRPANAVPEVTWKPPVGTAPVSLIRDIPSLQNRPLAVRVAFADKERPFDVLGAGAAHHH